MKVGEIYQTKVQLFRFEMSQNCKNQRQIEIYTSALKGMRGTSDKSHALVLSTIFVFG